MSVVWVLTCAIIYLDFIANTTFEHTYTARHDTRYTMCTSFSNWNVGESEWWGERNVSGSLELMKSIMSAFYPCLNFFFSLRVLGLVATFPLRFCNDVTTHTVKVRVKHFNAQFTTINTLKSYWFALWLRSVTTESEWMKEKKKKFLRDIELTIKQ